MKGILLTLDEQELSELLRKELAELLQKEFSQWEQRQQEQERPELLKHYYTAKEAANKLRISLPTLWRYEKDGLITAKRFGRRVLYERAVVDNIQTTRGR